MHYLMWCKYTKIAPLNCNIAPQLYNIMQKINIYKYGYQCIMFYRRCVWV